uniref:Uncharacterized protein n=2 Tax=Sphaeramia orbicularis TaxID=375764 RepID=A0A672YC97_9TELE
MQHDANQTISSSSSLQLGTDMSETAAKKKTSVQTRGDSKRSKKVSILEPSSPAEPASSSQSTLSLTSSLNSTTLSSKKKKQKLADQIKITTMPSSTPASPVSSSPQPTSVLKATKKPLHMSNPESRSASRDVPSDSDPRATTSRNTVLIKTSSDGPQTTYSQHKSVVKKKVSQQAKATPSPSTAKTRSLDSNLNNNSSRSNSRSRFWEDDDEEKEDLRENEVLWKSGGGLQANITLQDVKATLGRTKNNHQHSRGSILHQIETTSSLDTTPNTAGKKQKDISLVKMVSQPGRIQSSASLQHKEPKPENCSKSDLPEPVSPGVFPNHLSSVLSQDMHITHSSSMREGLRMDHHMLGLLSVTPPVNQHLKLTPPSSSSAHLSPLAQKNLPVKVETERTEQRPRMERKSNTAQNGSEGGLTQRCIGQVTLRELPEWLACRTPSRPRDVLEMVQRGWRWYYTRYIDVKKGGVGGLGMLLAGYCMLSYIWSYPHLKRDRWRKYH